MVILIGGNSCTGKTNLADKLLKIHNMPYFSIDYLKMGLYRSDKDCGFKPTDSNEIIAAKLWPILKEMIKTYIENKQDVIIEGCYIMPKHISEFEDEYEDNIINVFLGFSKDYVTNNYETGIIKYRSIIEKRDYEEDRTLEQFIQEHENFKVLCKKSGTNYFEIDTNYKEEMEYVIEFINGKLSFSFRC